MDKNEITSYLEWLVKYEKTNQKYKELHVLDYLFRPKKVKEVEDAFESLLEEANKWQES